MARGKKKESALTPEEKLAQALVPESEQPYKVPDNWCWTTVGQLCSFVGGGTPDKANPAYWNGDIPWASVKDIKGDRLYDTIDRITYDGLENSSSNLCEKDELILVTRIEPGKAIISQIGTAINQDLKVVKSKLSASFLYRYFQTFQHEFENKSSGSTVKGITIPNVQGTMFPLPPLAEQQRIVDRIESLFAKLDEAKEKAQTALDSFETRKAAILHKAFTGELTAKWRANHGDQIGDIDVSPLDKAYDVYDVPHDLPESWRWVRFNDCCTFVGSGVTPKGGKEVYQTTGVPFIRSQNVLKGTLDLSDVVYITFETDATMKRTRILGGETLFNITGASIGRACFVPLSQKMGNVNQHVCILRYKNYVVSELPQFWLNSPAVQDFVIGNQIGQTRQALNFKQIRGMHYPLAPMGEQVEIIRILDNLFAKEQQAKEAAEAVLEKINLLKKSILARAFRGELGTNDPNDESAVELLKGLFQA